MVAGRFNGVQVPGAPAEAHLASGSDRKRLAEFA